MEIFCPSVRRTLPLELAEFIGTDIIGGFETESFIPTSTAFLFEA